MPGGEGIHCGMGSDPDLPARLILFASNTGLVLLLFLAMVGPGRLLLRALRLKFDSGAARNLHALAFGFLAVSLPLYLLGVAGFFRLSVIASVLALALVAALVEAPALVRESLAGLRSLLAAARSPGVGRFEKWLAGALGGFLLLLFTNCFLPVVHTDPLGYQLAVPQQWLFEGRIFFLPTHLTSELPAGVLMLYGAVIGLRGWESGAAACQLVDFGFFLASLAAIHQAVGRLSRPAAGRCPSVTRQAPLLAVALYATTTGVAYWSVLPYLAAPSTFFLIMGLDWLSRWVARPLESVRPVVMAGLMGGLAAFCKVHGGLFAGAAGILVLVGIVRGFRLARSRGSPPSEPSESSASGRPRLRLVAAGGLYVLLMAAVAAPWYVRSWAETGNPVFPVANGIFRSPCYSVSGADRYTPGRQYPIAPWMAVGFLWEYADNNSDPQRVIGPAWLLPIALALLQWRRLSAASRSALGLGLAYSLLFCLLKGNLRYANVLMAVLALPAGEALALAAARLGGTGRFRSALALKCLFAVLLSAAALLVIRVSDAQSLEARVGMALRCWGCPGALADYAGTLEEESTNTVKVPGYEAMLAARRLVPPTHRVLLAGIRKEYLLQRRHLIDSVGQVAFSFEPPGGAPAAARRLAELGVEWVIWPEPDVRENVSRKKMNKLGKYWSDPAHVEFAEKFTEVVVRTPDATLRRLVLPPDALYSR